VRPVTGFLIRSDRDALLKMQIYIKKFKCYFFFDIMRAAAGDAELPVPAARSQLARASWHIVPDGKFAAAALDPLSNQFADGSDDGSDDGQRYAVSDREPDSQSLPGQSATSGIPIPGGRVSLHDAPDVPHQHDLWREPAGWVRRASSFDEPFPAHAAPFERGGLSPQMSGQATFGQTQPGTPTPQQPETPAQPGAPTQAVAPPPMKPIEKQPHVPLTSQQLDNLKFFRRVAENQASTEAETKRINDIFLSTALNAKTLGETKEIGENLVALIFSDPKLVKAFTDWAKYTVEQKKQFISELVKKASEYLGIDVTTKFKIRQRHLTASSKGAFSTQTRNRSA
jgi:hypothetical protein